MNGFLLLLFPAGVGVFASDSDQPRQAATKRVAQCGTAGAKMCV